MERVYIDSFIDDLNYRAVILHVDQDIDLNELYIRLNDDNVNHLYRFDSVRDNRLFYIENCDLQDITIKPTWNELLELIESEYSVLNLKKDANGYYIVVPDNHEMRRAIIPIVMSDID